MKASKKKKLKQQKEDTPVNVNIEMTGKNMTVNSGLIPILNFMKKLKFSGVLRNNISIERGSNSTYNIAEIIQMVIVSFIAGATAMTHIGVICNDEVIRKIAGWDIIPVDTTVGRIMRLFSFRNIVELTSSNHDFRSKVWKQALLSGHDLKCAKSFMILDVDSTFQGVYGEQEGAKKGYNPKKKGQKGYNPLMVFVHETGEVLHSWFRCGNAYTSNGIVEFMKECKAHISDEIKLMVRGDSGFFTGELLDYLESLRAGYLIKVKLKNLVLLLSQQNWSSIPGHPGYEQTVFYYKCAGWSHERRFLAVRYLKKDDKSGLFPMPDYDYFCYVTTDESLTPLQVHHKYGERATCETWIDECKNQMKACNIRTEDFFANAALFQCSILAYNIIKWMALLAGGKIRHWEVKTIRLYIVRVAGKLIESARQLTLKLPRMFLYQDEWSRWEHMSVSVSFD